MQEKDLINKFNKLLENFNFYKNYNSIEIKTKEDIKKIPITTRDDINNFDYKDCPVKAKWIRNTSGSTGAPTLFYFSENSVKNFIIRINKSFNFMDIHKDVIFNVIEDFVIPFLSLDMAGPLLFNAMGSDWSNKLSIFKIEKVRPTVIMAPPFMVLDLIKEMHDKSFLSKVITGGMVITDSFRQTLKEKTNAEILELYGTTEAGVIASQEKEGRDPMTLFDDGLFLEVLKANGEVSEFGKGKLLITDLENFSMPIIRYDIGDLVEISCEGETKFIKIFGKVGDHIKLADNLISKSFITSQVIDVMGSDYFLIEIHNSKETLNDFFVVKLPEEKIEFKEKVIEKLSEFFDLDVIVETLNDELKSFGRGKLVNIVDVRNKD